MATTSLAIPSFPSTFFSLFDGFWLEIHLLIKLEKRSLSCVCHRKTPTQLSFLTLFCQIRMKVLPLHPATPAKLPNLVFCGCFVNCVFKDRGDL